jgi:hypothetical protein
MWVLAAVVVAVTGVVDGDRVVRVVPAIPGALNRAVDALGLTDGAAAQHTLVLA